MSEQPVLDVFGSEWFAEQGIILKIDHPEREIVTRGKECFGLPQFFIG